VQRLASEAEFDRFAKQRLLADRQCRYVCRPSHWRTSTYDVRCRRAGHATGLHGASSSCLTTGSRSTRSAGFHRGVAPKHGCFIKGDGKCAGLIRLGWRFACRFAPSCRPIAQVTIDVSKITREQCILYTVANPHEIAVWLSRNYNDKRATAATTAYPKW
jgi:hypothetical protein